MVSFKLTRPVHREAGQPAEGTASACGDVSVHFSPEVCVRLTGGAIGCWMLRRICPTGETGYLDGRAYAHRSKLATLLGEAFFDEIRGRTVIDFGCGAGDQSVEMAKRGAGRVIGVDINTTLLAAARKHADAQGVADRCRFMTTPDERADIVVSLDAFEHFDDPARILRIMDTYLAAGGKVIASFGPTWYHPLGGHTFSVFPWAHLVFTEQALLRWRKSFRPRQQAARITDCGLNKITVRRFERTVAESPFRFAAFEARPIRGIRVFTLPVLREFGTSVVRCTLIRKTDPVARDAVPPARDAPF
jgi:2-polyprenyl-3-methyl-5-hydroxy-6-metoxy-1,4-benzoquinol methylase